MKRKRHTQEQIIAILKEHEAGMKTADLCRKHGISEASFYSWKAKYGGLEVSEAKRAPVPDQLPQSYAYASPENMACPLRPPYRFDTKVESQIQHSEKPADSVNPENALEQWPEPSA